MTCHSERSKLLAAMLGAATIAAWSIPASADTVRVRSVRVSETAGDTAIAIATSARPTFTTWKLEQPARVVIEFSGARLGDVKVPMDAGTYAVGLVSASVTEDESAGPRTRVVLTLRQASDYRVETKGNEVVLRVVPRIRPQIAAQSRGSAKAESEAKARLEAQARVQEQRKLEAEAKAAAENRARLAAQARAEEQKELAAEAKAKAEAESKARLEAQARAERQRKAAVEAKARAEAEGKARLEAQARAEQQRKVAVEAKAEAAAVTAAKRKTEAQLREEARQRLAAEAKAEAHSRSEAAAKREADRLRNELALAQQEAAKAKAEATAATQESERQRLALEQAERRVRQFQSEAESALQHAQSMEDARAAARAQEIARDRALRAATIEVENRQQTLDRIAQQQEQQQAQLNRAEHLVGEREAAVRASEAKLAALDKEARAARLRHEGLARDASAKRKAEVAAELVEAERQRGAAAKDAEQSRQDLAQAINLRKQEEIRTEEQGQLRRTEEVKLRQAVAMRKAEETRLVEARAEYARLDDERKKLEAERTRLERARQSLIAEVSRLKKTASTSPSAGAPRRTSSVPVTSPAPSPLATDSYGRAVGGATRPPMAANAHAAPRSVTLHALSRVRAIDFIDEPSRASVIIDIDESATFTVERLAGRRLSLRIEHSTLPESLERHLDATEYLGPVKVISSYRDRKSRGTVRVDVDLAEDVPNRVRVDGNRIFWQFQKAPTRAPSLPAVLFVPAQKVAGFVAVAKDGLWVAQAPPYLAAPSEAAPAEPPSAAPARARAPDPRPTAAPGGRVGIGKKRYVGRRIDLDFKGADIHNILRLLADVGQVNVIVADDVRGDVTIKMRDVPWDQALDVVLRSKGLGSVREGNLLRVAPLPLLEKELEAEIARQKQIQDVLPTETRLIGVSYADAGALQSKARDLLTSRGKISVDSRTNTLIVSDVVKSLQLIEDLVRNLDTQTSQVVIEARIVEANSNFARQIGVQWGGSGYADTAHGNPTGLVFPYNVGIGGGADDGAAPLGGLVPYPRNGDGTTNPNFLVNMPVSAGLNTGSAIGLTLGSVAGAFNLNLRLSAMESTGSIRILSSPRIVTMDNEQATISQGVSIPVSTVSAMGAQTQFVDAKLNLQVKPHVTNEGTIALDVSVTRNEPDFVNTGARGDPTIQKKEAKTSMLVRDGDTAVIGGIYTRNTGLSSSRVPFFSDIPVLGWFFRNRRENDNRSEFMIFITPRIVNRARSIAQ